MWAESWCAARILMFHIGSLTYVRSHNAYIEAMSIDSRTVAMLCYTTCFEPKPRPADGSGNL